MNMHGVSFSDTFYHYPIEAYEWASLASVRQGPLLRQTTLTERRKNNINGKYMMIYNKCFDIVSQDIDGECFVTVHEWYEITLKIRHGVYENCDPLKYMYALCKYIYLCCLSPHLNCYNTDNHVVKITWKHGSVCNCKRRLLYLGRDKVAVISQTTVSNAFSWIKMLEFWFQGSNEVGAKPLSEPMMVCIYSSLGLHELFIVILQLYLNDIIRWTF